MKEGFQVDGTNQSGTREQPSKLCREAPLCSTAVSVSIYLVSMRSFHLLGSNHLVAMAYLTDSFLGSFQLPGTVLAVPQ